jgi:outer membrane receptor protein involved in Fe transport
MSRASLRQLNGYVDKLSSSTTVRDDYTRFNLNADATYYAAFKGQHQIKAGFQFERLGNDVLTGQTQPTITLNWNASRSTFDGRQVRGTYGYWSTTKNVVTVGDIHANNVGVFAQDAWTISQRLTLNLGIRAESEDIP